MAAIEVRELVKQYGQLRAVDGISFTVEPGQVFGMLGPNGAGKSTTTEIVEGLRRPDSGSVAVLGVDVLRQPEAVKQRIGIQLQTTALYQKQTTRELVVLFGSFFRQALPADELLALVNLEEKAGTLAKDLSGGQRQRLAVAIALVNDPEVVFLDEPTTGLDPQARRSMWDVIAALRGRGKTVFLTTHYMEEAERLCDWIAVVDHGKIIAEGTPAGLIRANFAHTALEFTRDERLGDDALRALPGAEELRAENGSAILYSSNAARTTGALMALAEQRGVELAGFALRGATLEDVFLKLTGRRIRD